MPRETLERVTREMKRYDRSSLLFLPKKGCGIPEDDANVSTSEETFDFLGAFSFANDVVFVRFTDIRRLFCCSECFLDRVLSRMSIALLFFGGLSLHLGDGVHIFLNWDDEKVVVAAAAAAATDGIFLGGNAC